MPAHSLGVVPHVARTSSVSHPTVLIPLGATVAPWRGCTPDVPANMLTPTYLPMCHGLPTSPAAPCKCPTALGDSLHSFLPRRSLTSLQHSSPGSEGALSIPLPGSPSQDAAPVPGVLTPRFLPTGGGSTHSRTDPAQSDFPAHLPCQAEHGLCGHSLGQGLAPRPYSRDREAPDRLDTVCFRQSVTVTPGRLCSGLAPGRALLWEGAADAQAS